LATFHHPASLNPLQQFSQACSILRNTSRAKNAAWYQEALELDFQLHLRSDGPSITSFYFNRKKDQWSKGPSVTEDTLNDSAKTDALITEALLHARSNGASSLGVILHIADEFATTELKPELDNPAALGDLRETAVVDPVAVLSDSSIQADQGSWRILPYPAAGSEAIGTVITVSRQYAAFFDALRLAGESNNFPIISHALSAPLVAMMGLSQSLQPTPGKAFIAILQYPWVTALAFFNEHADLRLIRTLQHRGLRRPTNFRNTLATSNASLEFIDPDLFLVPLGSQVDTALAADLKISFSSSRVEVISSLMPDGMPEWCPEPVIASLPAVQEAASIKSHTFSILRDEKWALQNFLPTPREIVEIYPSRSEMALLRALRLARVALFAITALSLAYFAFGALNLLRKPEWAFNPDDAKIANQRLAKFNEEKNKSTHWANLLEDRSKAWVAMEGLARMFPQNGGMRVRNFVHTVKPDSGAGKAAVGFVKEWKITGFARDEALSYLNTINTREGITAHFSEVARVTGNPAFDPSTGNRNLVVNVRTQENSGFKPVPPEEASISDDSTYPFTFDLTITQRFEATDPLVINVTKAPGRKKKGK
jgi:hypothetical protein